MGAYYNIYRLWHKVRNAIGYARDMDNLPDFDFALDFVGTDPTERPFYKGFMFLAIRRALRYALF